MANNPHVNKVTFGNNTIMDITDTSADASNVIEGKVFYNSTGARTVGTLGDMSGATASEAGAAGLVPAPASGDNDKFLAGDGTWKEGGKPMVILSYGSSTWNDFITAYNNNIIVYCRASSNSNPASGTQNRLAFMAYVNNAATPTEVEFQYYRSVNPNQKSATQMSDQVFVYKLTSSGTWSVTTREASLKQVIAGTNITTSYSNNQLTINAPANVSAFTNDAGYLTSYTETDPTVPAWAKTENKPTYTAAEVGAIADTLKGAANGVAELDASGKVPASQLPAYVDDVLEYNSASAFPATGESDKIYIAKDTNVTYRWGGSAYVSIGSDLALGETSSTAYRGDYGAAAYAHGVTNKGSAFTSGLYKITTNSEGHVTAATAVVKADITGLGIPAQDTTYSSLAAADGGTDVSLVTTGEKHIWNNSYLPLTGGTISGNLIWKSNSIDASKADNNISSITYPTTFNILDKEGRILTRTEGVIDPNGDISAYWYVRNYDTSGNQVGQKGIQMTMHKSGTLTYSVADADKFRSAISSVCTDGDMITGTLVLSKTTDASGTADNLPALLIGGTSSQSHIEIDSNEIMAKHDATTPTDLYLNADGAPVHLCQNHGTADTVYADVRSELDASDTSTGAFRVFGGVGIAKKLYVGSNSYFNNTMHIFPAAGSYCEGIRIHAHTNNWSDLILCGTDNTSDSGTSTNTWGIFNNNGSFYITRNGSSSGAASFSCISNIWTLNDKLTIKTSGTTTDNQGAILAFSNTDTTINREQNTAYIAAYNTHANNNGGMNMVIHPGGNLFVGSGESAAQLYPTYQASTKEDLFITSDGTAYIYANAQTIANRIGFAVTTAGAIIPQKAEANNSNAQTIGTSSVLWQGIYSTAHYGSQYVISDKCTIQWNSTDESVDFVFA